MTTDWCDQCGTGLRDGEEGLCEDCALDAQRDAWADQKYDERREADPRERWSDD